jgi:hypothetical protein
VLCALITCVEQDFVEADFHAAPPLFLVLQLLDNPAVLKDIHVVPPPIALRELTEYARETFAQNTPKDNSSR